MLVHIPYQSSTGYNVDKYTYIHTYVHNIHIYIERDTHTQSHIQVCVFRNANIPPLIEKSSANIISFSKRNRAKLLFYFIQCTSLKIITKEIEIMALLLFLLLLLYRNSITKIEISN